MADWPDKWTPLRFDVALEEWRDRENPDPLVYAEVERWCDSRQDAPHGDTEPLPIEGDLPGSYAVLARVFDLYRRPVLNGGRPVVCAYEINETEKTLTCEYFRSF